MKRVLSAEEMRRVDAAAAEHGMPNSLLMENAGALIAQTALFLAAPNGRFVVLCGPGNNGGDGLVAARHLSAAGRKVAVELVGKAAELEGEAARNARAVAANGLSLASIAAETPMGSGDVVIDAVFGSGLNRAPEGLFADAVKRMDSWRAAGAKVVAADLPSGLQSDSSRPFTPSVRADVTIALGFLKPAHVNEPGASQCGRVEVVDIGIPRAAERVLGPWAVHLLEERDAQSRIPARRAEGHKGTYGHVLIVGGSQGKTGAAALTARAALRSGAGLVTVASRGRALSEVMRHSPELMGVELAHDGPLALADLNALLEAADGKQAVVIGPGIQRGEETARLLGALLEEIDLPVVLDADALNALAGNSDLLGRAKGDLVLTPHPGEMARLVEKSTAEVNSDRVGVARSFAMQHSLVLILKGARTVIARDDGVAFVNPTGNPGMATAGTGDVLAGMVGALLAQGLSAEDAAVVGTWAHGAAGDLAASHHGQLGLIASDVIEHLGSVWTRWAR